jgi:hypothetical protein
VRRVDPVGLEPLLPLRADEQVGRAIALEVPSLHEDGAGSEREDRRRGTPHVVAGHHLEPGKPCRLGEVRCDERRERQDRPSKSVDGVIGEQRVPVLRNEDGVDDDVRERHLRGRLRHGLDDGGRGEHPRLGRIDTDVTGHGPDLLGHRRG